LTLIFLFFFLILIGFRASSWRAALLGVAVLLSLQLGRLKQALNLLLFIAVLLLLFNPRLLVADVGFQLSFLAVLGIMYLSEPIKKFLQRRLPFIQTSFLTDILALTLSAQCMVFPLVVYYFGQLSLIAPLANLLVLPLLPAVLVLGFVLVSFGFLSTWLASLVAFVLQPLLNWIIYLSHFLSAWPYGHLQFPGASTFWLFLNYLLLFLVLIRIFFKIYYNLKSDLRGTCPEIRSVKPRVSNN
jgi:competence protein ComEC